MCSSSTTLFNAALRAGLQMGARSNHKYYITRYPLGLDATVSITRGGRQTMSFTNDMDHPIVIRAFRIRRGTAGYVRYQIWGVPDGRTVTLSRPVRVQRPPGDDQRRHGVARCPAASASRPSTRRTAWTCRSLAVVRNANGRVIHSDTYRTHYVLWNGRIEVGA